MAVAMATAETVEREEAGEGLVNNGCHQRALGSSSSTQRRGICSREGRKTSAFGSMATPD